MKNSKLLTRHAFFLDLLCMLLCFALLYLGTNDKLPYWMLATGAIIAFVAFVASIFLFVKARKIDSEESRRIEKEILDNAAKVDAVDKAIEEGDIVDEQDDYKIDED